MDKNTLYIDDDTVYFNQYDKPLYRDCEMVDTYRKYYPYNGVDQVECKANSLYLVTYYSYGTNTFITRCVCERHLALMVDSANFMQWSIMDNRKG